MRVTPQNPGVQNVNQPVGGASLRFSGSPQIRASQTSSIGDAVNDLENLGKMWNQQVQTNERGKAQTYFAQNLEARQKDRAAWNQRVASGQYPESSNPYFQEEILKLDGRAAGLEYRDALLAQAHQAARAIDPQTGKLVADPNLAAISNGVAEQFAGTYSLTTKEGSEEFAKYKILAQEEFKSEYARLRGAQEEEYFRQRKSQEMAQILQSFNSVDPSAPGMDAASHDLNLKAQWKKANDELLQFAGVNGRAVAANAIHQFMMSGLGDAASAKKVMAALPMIAGLPVGTSTVSKDGELWSVVAQMRGRLADDIRRDEREARADHKEVIADAAEAWSAKWSDKLLYNKKMGIKLGPVLDDAIADASNLPPEAQAQAVARLTSLTHNMEGLSEVSDISANKQKHNDYLQLVQDIRAGKNGAITAARNASLLGDDRAAMNVFLAGWATGDILTNENGGSNWIRDTEQMIQGTKLPAIELQIRQSRGDVMREARAIAVDPKIPDADKPQKISDLFAEATKKLDTDVASTMATLQKDADAVRKVVNDAHGKNMAAGDYLAGIQNPLDYFHPNELRQWQEDEQKYSNPLWGTGASDGKDVEGFLLKELKIFAEDKSEVDIEPAMRQASELWPQMWNEKVAELRKNTPPAQLKAAISAAYPGVIRDAAQKAAKDFMSNQAVKGEMMNDKSEVGKRLKETVYLDNQPAETAARANWQAVRSEFKADFQNHPDNYTTPLQLSIRKAMDGVAIAHDVSKSPKEQADGAAMMNDALLLLTKADSTTTDPVYRIGLRRLIESRGINDYEFVNGAISIRNPPLPKVSENDITGLPGRNWQERYPDTGETATIIKLGALGLNWFRTPIFADWNNPKVQDDIFKAMGLPAALKDKFIQRQIALTSGMK